MSVPVPVVCLNNPISVVGSTEGTIWRYPNGTLRYTKLTANVSLLMQPAPSELVRVNIDPRTFVPTNQVAATIWNMSTTSLIFTSKTWNIPQQVRFAFKKGLGPSTTLINSVRQYTISVNASAPVANTASWSCYKKPFSSVGYINVKVTDVPFTFSPPYQCGLAVPYSMGCFYADTFYYN